ncbi:MAG: hypothetical protein JST12_14225 [Armatimonadetes bacterium]|nr:hypothetical protein [Armatimonadota bacterium]
MRRSTFFGELLVTCLLIAVAYAIGKPIANQIKYKLKYDNEMTRLHKLFGAVSLYAGQNDDRFPSSISDYDRYLMSVRKMPTDDLALSHYWYPGTCALLAEVTGSELCTSNIDSVPDVAQPADHNFISWKAMTGSAYNTSSRFGVFHVALSSTWNCPTMPMFWTHIYEDTGDDPMRVTYFEGETKLVTPEEFAVQMSCLKDNIIAQ